MYDVEVLVPEIGLGPAVWTPHTSVSQMGSDAAELGEARRIARSLGSFYCRVRVVKWLDGSTRWVVV